jgi:hypothetical protein
MRFCLLVLCIVTGCAAAAAQTGAGDAPSSAIRTIEAYFKARERDDAAAMQSMLHRAVRWKAKSALKTFEGGHGDIVDDLKIIGFDAPPRIRFTVMDSADEVATLQVDYTGLVDGALFTVTRMETFIVVGGRIEMLDAEYTGMRAAE